MLKKTNPEFCQTYDKEQIIVSLRHIYKTSKMLITGKSAGDVIEPILDKILAKLQAKVVSEE